MRLFKMYVRCATDGPRTHSRPNLKAFGEFLRLLTKIRLQTAVFSLSFLWVACSKLDTFA
jgi:hypothetical protein